MSDLTETSESFARLRIEMERPPFNKWILVTPLSVNDERREVEIALSYKPEFSHHPREPIFHGGVVAAVVDIVAHAAVAVWLGRPAPTVTLQIDYLAPAIGPELHARGILRRMGRTVSRADAEIIAGGKLVSIGRGTFSTKEV